MKIFKAIIVDDEVNNVLILKHFISKFCLNLEIIGEALSVEDAISEINGKNPDIAFLDVRLKDEEVFSVLDQIDSSNMQIIFVTAYDEYALKAFKYNAIDYILKPISIEELILAVNKAIKKIQQQNYFDFKNFTTTYKAPIENNERKDYVAIASQDKIDVLKTEEIMYIEAESKYTTFYLKDNKILTSNKNLAYYENALDEAHFFRVHNSYIVGLKYVSRIIKKDGSYCELLNGFLVPIAKRKQEEFNRFLKIRD
ncbi:MAG: response regulator transcription factor [Chitinophagaceae bacterium]|nr:MAG: response regulator transcription factor [Chitinophagaceae bacterium]